MSVKMTISITDYMHLYEMDMNITRASIMETIIFRYLNGSHLYTSFIYNFLIVASNKHSIQSTQNLTQIS